MELADNELRITHGTKPYIHRVVFKSKDVSGVIPVQSSIFFKLKSKFKSWKKQTPLNYWKSESMTLGLSNFGRIIIYVKSNLEVFPKEFLRCLRKDFELTEHEIGYLINRLDFVELEIAHKINDPNGKLKNAKIKYNLEDLLKKILVFTDESQGSLELEIKGDPATSGNLEFLLRDKVNAILYFAELTKIMFKLSEIQNELLESITYVKNGLYFLIDDLINKRFSEQKTKQVNK